MYTDGENVSWDAICWLCLTWISKRPPPDQCLSLWVLLSHQEILFIIFPRSKTVSLLILMWNLGDKIGKFSSYLEAILDRKKVEIMYCFNCFIIVFYHCLLNWYYYKKDINNEIYYVNKFLVTSEYFLIISTIVT